MHVGAVLAQRQTAGNPERQGDGFAQQDPQAEVVEEDLAGAGDCRLDSKRKRRRPLQTTAPWNGSIQKKRGGVLAVFCSGD